MRAPSRQISEPVDAPLDGRTKSAKRYETLVAELSATHGTRGPKGLSAKLKIRSAAALAVRLEAAQASAASGEPFEPRELSELSELTTRAIRDAVPQSLELPMFDDL